VCITLNSFNCRYRNSFTARASKAAWKKEMVCKNWKAGITVARLMSRPVNSKLFESTRSDVLSKYGQKEKREDALE
jgi:hypothetical protein